MEKQKLFDQEDILFNLTQMSPSESNSENKDILLNYLKFCEEEIAPTRVISDEEGLIFDKGEVKTPACLKKLHKEYYENGWFGVGVEEEFSGTPLPMKVVSALTSLSIGCNTAWFLYPALSKGCMNVLIKLGTKKIHEEIVSKMMVGRFGGTMCLTESQAGSDVGAITTFAKKIPNPQNDPEKERLYTLTGEKIFISSGQNDLYENIVHLVLAKTQQNSGVKDISLFMVLRNSNNVICEKIEHKMGIHASATCVLRFENSVGELIGNLGEGMANMFIMMNEARLLCALQGESQAHMAYQRALDYASTRVQFAQPIIQHPDVARMLLQLRASSRGMRALCEYTANMIDAGQERIEFLTPIAKSYCTDEGFLCTVMALQVFGGYGYCKEYGMEQYVRDSKIASIYEGTNGIQAKDFIFRKILKDKGQNLQDIFKDIQLTLSKADKSDPNFNAGLEELQYALGEASSLFQSLEKNPWTNGDLAFYSTSFLTLMAHLVVSWLLLEQAMQANNLLKLGKNTDFSNDYLGSKVVDFQVYAGNYLTRNRGIISSILTGRKMRTYGIK